MSTEAPESEPEVITTGMAPLSHRTKRGLLVGVLVLALLAGGFAAWRLWPRPAAPFTLADLQGVYAGMVRSDGTNDASVLSRENFDDSEAAVDPAGCEPLFEATSFSRFPASALDGVGTYWPNDRVAISLFTFRFTDPEAANQAFTRVADAATACAGKPLSILPRGRDQPPTQEIRTEKGTISLTATEPLDHVDQQTAYLFTTTSGVKFAVQMFVYNNLVSWQFRYDPQPGAYDPTPAGQLDYSLATQMYSVEQSRAQ